MRGESLLAELINAVTTADFRWPPALDPRTICFTVDVEWAADEVLADLRGLFDQHGVRATFFVTHAGVKVPGHERGLHPNFRRDGDTYERCVRAMAVGRHSATKSSTPAS